MEPEGCGSCQPAYMREEGCCSEDVGFGTKTVWDNHSKQWVTVCASLRKQPHGKWDCGDYYNRPPECRQFECVRSLGEDGIDFDSEWGIW